MQCVDLLEGRLLLAVDGCLVRISMYIPQPRCLVAVSRCMYNPCTTVCSKLYIQRMYSTVGICDLTAEMHCSVAVLSLTLWVGARVAYRTEGCVGGFESSGEGAWYTLDTKVCMAGFSVGGNFRAGWF